MPPSNPLVGFLPPEDGTGRGEGYVTYSISPSPGVANGTTVSNVAEISFDDSTEIATNEQEPNTPPNPSLDDTVTLVTVNPTSSITSPLETTPGTPVVVNTPTFNLTWGGTDTGGPGIAYYNVFVSIDGGQYASFLSHTTLTSATYTPKLSGNHTYAFYTQAVDFVGNTQAPVIVAGETPAQIAPNTAVEVETVVPTVVNTLVAGTGWSSTYLSYLETIGTGQRQRLRDPRGLVGPAHDPAVDQLERDRDRLQHQCDGDRVGLEGRRRQQVDLTASVASATTRRPSRPPGRSPRRSATTMFFSKLDGSDASGVNAGGVLLDGAWTNGASVYPSGNGAAGSNFDFQFDVLPGDVNASGGVNLTDYLLVRARSATRRHRRGTTSATTSPVKGASPRRRRRLSVRSSAATQPLGQPERGNGHIRCGAGPAPAGDSPGRYGVSPELGRPGAGSHLMGPVRARRR